MRYEFEAELWMHTGQGTWHFVTLPIDVADEIADITEPARRGFGSVRVSVTLGASTWQTSIFPDKAAESYVLPVKKPVRTAEDVHDGDRVEIMIELVDLAG